MTAGNFTVPASQTTGFFPASESRFVEGEERQADLEISMGYLGSWDHEQIIIENVGDADAEDIVISADGSPIEQHRCWVSGQTLLRRLRPGEQLGVKFVMTMGAPERADVRVTWKEEDGAEKTTERMVQLM